MGVNLNRNLRQLVVQEESTPGTMETDLATADNVIRFRDIEISPAIEFDDENSKYANGSHAQDEAIAGVRVCTLTASVKVTYSGTATTEPQWWKLAKICGLGAIGWDSGSEVAAGSAADGVALVSRAAYDDTPYTCWVLDKEIGSSPATSILKLKGCVGNGIFTCEGPGKTVYFNATISGVYNDLVDGSDIAINAATQTQLAEPFINSAFTIGGKAEKIGSWQLDLGNEVTPIYSQADAGGVLHYAITARRPTFSCNPLAVKQATRDWFNEVVSQTTSAISCPIGTNMTVKGLDAQCMNPSLAAREGLVNYDLNFRLLQNGTPGSLTDAALDLEDTLEFLHGART